MILAATNAAVFRLGWSRPFVLGALFFRLAVG
jgi:hypothetical protein